MPWLESAKTKQTKLEWSWALFSVNVIMDYVCGHFARARGQNRQFAVAYIVSRWGGFVEGNVWSYNMEFWCNSSLVKVTGLSYISLLWYPLIYRLICEARLTGRTRTRDMYHRLSFSPSFALPCHLFSFGARKCNSVLWFLSFSIFTIGMGVCRFELLYTYWTRPTCRCLADIYFWSVCAMTWSGPLLW